MKLRKKKVNRMKLAIFGAGMIVKDFLTMIHDIPEVELTAIMGTPRDLPTMEELQKIIRLRRFILMLKSVWPIQKLIRYT
jgi:hypothetical protein